MPGCEESGTPNSVENYEMPKAVPYGGFEDYVKPVGPFIDPPYPITNKPLVKDLTIDELEELIEKCLRRVLYGAEIRRELERLKAREKL